MYLKDLFYRYIHISLCLVCQFFFLTALIFVGIIYYYNLTIRTNIIDTFNTHTTQVNIEKLILETQILLY